MKTQLTKEQSQRLLMVGVPKEKASINDSYYSNKNHTIELYTVFKLEDLLNGEILPKEIELPKEETYLYTNANLVIYGFEGEWDVEYEYIDTTKGSLPYMYFQDKELIDALYELACWYYGEYLKSEKK